MPKKLNIYIPKKPIAHKIRKIKPQTISPNIRTLVNKRLTIMKIKAKVNQLIKKYPDIKKGLANGFKKITEVLLNAEKEISQLRSDAKNNSDINSLINQLDSRKERFFSQTRDIISSSNFNLITFSELQISAERFIADASGIRRSLYKPLVKDTRTNDKRDYNPRIHGSK